MTDYVSLEAAIKKIRVAADCAECDGNSSDLCGCNFCDVYNAICLVKSLPAADVEPVRHVRIREGEEQYVEDFGWFRWNACMWHGRRCGE